MIGQYLPGFYSRTFRSHTYRGQESTIKQAENMMRGDHSDVLWRKVEREARKLIWC